MMTEKEQKTAEGFVCKYCDFTCFKKSNFDRHLLTRKHKIVTNDDVLEQKELNKYACVCGKEYVYRQGLHNHKKICPSNKEKEAPEEAPEEVTSLTNMVMELIKSNSELQKQLVDVCKNSNSCNNNNIQNHSNNKTFNLQFFLNEQCKDAMNISDFANSINLDLSDFESVGELGYVEGITKIMLDRLNSMDIYKRPIHCSDAKREIIYVRDDNKWEKEERNNPKLRYAIKTISFNNMKLMALWSSTYPESMDGESRLNDKYLLLIKQSTGGSGEITDSENKIIRRIAREIVIDKM